MFLVGKRKMTPENKRIV